jgi:hypothetical protein
MSHASELQERYFEDLLDKIRGVDYPSHQLMDRAESVMRTKDQALEYTDVLFDKVASLYPSLQIMDRIHRIMLLVEMTERREQLLEQVRG